LLLASAFAQQQPQPQTEPEVRIRAYTKLVQVPVVVTDGSGKAMRGLTQADFVLMENGKPVPIAVFEAVTAADATPGVPIVSRRAAVTPGVYSNFQEGKAEHRPVIILVLDAINTPFFAQARHREQLIKFLSEKIESGTLLSLLVMTRSGLRSIHEYTTDPRVLIAALRQYKGVVGTASAGDAGALASSQMPVVYSPDDAAKVQQEADRLNSLFNSQDEFSGLQRGVSLDVTLNALRAIAQMYSGVPGRKALIWAAGSFPHFLDDPRKLNSGDYNAKYFKTMDELGDASVSIYPIDASGLIGYEAPRVALAAPPSGATVGRRADPGLLSGMGDTEIGRVGENAQMVDRMKELAENTGGVPYYGTNDLAGAIRKAATDSSSYYLLGYYLRGGEPTKIDRRILKVQVKRSGAKVRHRARAYIMPQNFDPKREMMMAQLSPLEFTTLPLQVVFDPKQTMEGAIPFEIFVDGGRLELQEPGNRVNLDVVVVANGPEGNVLDMVNQTLSGNIKDAETFRQKPFAYRNRLRSISGPSVVRFIVRDNNSGKMGSVIVETP
ncbi:MAG: VWA domain-containing protein, partial [Terriglobales bacterium]